MCSRLVVPCAFRIALRLNCRPIAGALLPRRAGHSRVVMGVSLRVGAAAPRGAPRKPEAQRWEFAFGLATWTGFSESRVSDTELRLSEISTGLCSADSSPPPVLTRSMRAFRLCLCCFGDSDCCFLSPNCKLCWNGPGAAAHLRSGGARRGPGLASVTYIEVPS